MAHGVRYRGGMRHSSLVVLLLASSALVSAAGCVALECGGYEGQQNRVFERQSEMIVLCDNGGFVAALSASLVEGRFRQEGASTVATSGADGRLAFELARDADGSFAAPQLGVGAWSEVALDAVALDHSNKLCEDLPYRPWWAQP